MKKYYVTFTTKAGGFQRWGIRVQAKNEKAALKLVTEKWKQQFGQTEKIPFMFGKQVHQIPDTERLNECGEQFRRA